MSLLLRSLSGSKEEIKSHLETKGMVKGGKVQKGSVDLVISVATDVGIGDSQVVRDPSDDVITSLTFVGTSTRAHNSATRQTPEGRTEQRGLTRLLYQVFRTKFLSLPMDRNYHVTPCRTHAGWWKREADRRNLRSS